MLYILARQGTEAPAESEDRLLTTQPEQDLSDTVRVPQDAPHMHSGFHGRFLGDEIPLAAPERGAQQLASLRVRARTLPRMRTRFKLVPPQATASLAARNSARTCASHCSQAGRAAVAACACPRKCSMVRPACQGCGRKPYASHNSGPTQTKHSHLGAIAVKVAGVVGGGGRRGAGNWYRQDLLSGALNIFLLEI